MLPIHGVGRGRAPSNASSKPANSVASLRPVEVRLQKEFNELELPPGCSISFPDKNNLLAFNIEISPREGYWTRRKYIFAFTVSEDYPFSAPKVKCKSRLYHPNVDFDGNVCLNVLREDWKPVFCLETVFNGLLHIFLEPNTTEPLNDPVAQDLSKGAGYFMEKLRNYEDRSCY